MAHWPRNIYREDILKRSWWLHIILVVVWGMERSRRSLAGGNLPLLVHVYPGVLEPRTSHIDRFSSDSVFLPPGMSWPQIPPKNNTTSNSHILFAPITLSCVQAHRLARPAVSLCPQKKTTPCVMSPVIRHKAMMHVMIRQSTKRRARRSEQAQETSQVRTEIPAHR